MSEHITKEAPTMGATSMYRAPGQSHAEFFANELLRPSQSFVATSNAPGVFYAAVREADTGQVWALVILHGPARGFDNFWYKSMSEEAGPYETSPSAAVLDALTPTDSANANEWRSRAREYVDAQAIKPKVLAGTTIRFANPLRFGDGVERSVLRWLSGSVFADERGTRVRVPNWRKRPFSLA